MKKKWKERIEELEKNVFEYRVTFSDGTEQVFGYVPSSSSSFYLQNCKLFSRIDGIYKELKGLDENLKLLITEEDFKSQLDDIKLRLCKLEMENDKNNRTP